MSALEVHEWGCRCATCMEAVRRDLQGETIEAVERALGVTQAPRPTASDDAVGVPMFRRYTGAELVDADLSLRWLVEMFLTDPTYGQVAGELKALKSYLSRLLALSVASGTPYLGQFPVPEPRPVVRFIGEGGRIPDTRAMVTLARAMGVDLASLPIVSMYEVAPIGSMTFRATLERELAETPALVILDPLYAFHGTEVKSSNLHEEGSLLSSLSAPCIEAGASLMVVNHFNQTGTGTGLKRITQAGSGEWVDSWMLTGHREAPDVDNGRFKLALDIGSRQWGGSSWHVDFNLGHLDALTGTHDGEVSWECRPAGSGRADSVAQKILAAVDNGPGESTRELLAKAGGGNLEAARRTVDRLEREARIVRRVVTVTRTNGRKDQTWRYFPPSMAETPLDEGADQ